MWGRGEWGLVLCGLGAGCSSFETTKDVSGADAAASDATASDGGRYNAAGSIACDRDTCKTPGFCCVRQSTPNSCESETSRCTGNDAARVRCASGSACAPGNKCCMRLSNFNVQSIECEPTCTPEPGSSGVFQLCGEGESFGVCPAECVPLRTLLTSGATYPRLNVSACK